jgi:YggT family protein
LLFGANCTGTSAASQIICLFTTLLVIAIIARALLSWFNMDPRSPLIQALNQITEPILEPIRRIMPRLGMIDLSPLIAILLLQFLSAALQSQLG